MDQRHIHHTQQLGSRAKFYEFLPAASAETVLHDHNIKYRRCWDGRKVELFPNRDPLASEERLMHRTIGFASGFGPLIVERLRFQAVLQRLLFLDTWEPFKLRPDSHLAPFSTPASDGKHDPENRAGF